MKKFWGLIQYKPQWTLTLRGWLLILLLVLVLMLFIITQIQPFLAPSYPIKASALVVEGWVEDEVIEGAIAEFKRGDYRILITTGVPLFRGYHLAKYKNYANLAAATLIKLNFDPNKIVAVPGPKVSRNRTMACAIALSQWLSNSELQIKSINIYADDVHTRRSWLIFKEALAPDFEVGAIAHPAIKYEPKFWWTSSEGVRQIISETIAYLYACLISWSC
ncbi:MAG: YdcF family protein [Moorea sp. SIO2B7]|nr:YdcF family protein [Moorena sp. SIO2B7]